MRLRSTFWNLCADVVEACDWATKPLHEHRQAREAYGWPVAEQETSDDVSKPWCVVTDDAPFGVKVWSRHSTLAGAMWRASEWHRFQVMTAEEAARKDRQYVEDAERLYGPLR